MLNDLKADLVDKKLWPVVVLLVAALVAVPLLLSRGGKSSPGSDQAAVEQPSVAVPATTGAAGTAPADVPAPAVTLAGPAKSGKEKNRKGRRHDPFFVAATPAPTGAAGAVGTSGAPVASSGGSVGTLAKVSSSSPAPTSSSSSSAPRGAGTPSSAPQPLTKSARTFPLPPSASFSLGRSGAKPKTFTAPSRYTALPNDKTPVAYFGGVMKDRKTAVFLIAPASVNTGGGRCWPAPKTCRALELTAGHTAILSYLTRGGEFQHFRLKMGAVKSASTASFSRSVEGLSRTSRRGLALLTVNSLDGERTGASQYVFFPARGVLDHRKAHAKAASN